jgi:hypothetical protein
MVAVLALAWNTEVSAPPARVRLNATAANTSPALLAQDRPDGRWVCPLPFRSEPTAPELAAGLEQRTTRTRRSTSRGLFVRLCPVTGWGHQRNDRGVIADRLGYSRS